jgi:hypothetical protein
MGKALILAATLLLAFVYAAADDVKIEGKWVGQIPRPDHNYDAVFVFNVKGDKLTGTVKAAELDNELEIVDGKVKGDTISFRIGGTSGTYTGKVSGDEINCKVTLTGGEFGGRTLPFTLKRTKD